MKKLLGFTTLCILAGLVLSSCSSNVSIVKRHYRSGYYVDYTKKVPAVKKYASIKPERETTLTSLPSPALPGIPEQYVTNSNQINTLLSDVPANQKAPLEYSHAVASTKKILSQPFAVEKSAASVLQSTPFAYEGSAGYDDGAGAALSLLWIVIVVILIVWLIGLLAGGWGLGGLINLLLIIAIILLILWLLRIA